MNPETISLIVAAFSLMGTILVAVFNVRSAHVTASDKIAAGSSQLIDELQEARNRDKIIITDCQERLNEFEQWKKKVSEFMAVCWAGAKENEAFILSLGVDPPYRIPDFPFKIENENEK